MTWEEFRDTVEKYREKIDLDDIEVLYSSTSCDDSVELELIFKRLVTGEEESK